MSSFARTFTGDLDFSTHTLLVVQDPVQCAAWALDDKLSLAKGEWIYDVTQGVDYFSFMGVKNPSIPAITEMLRQVAMSVPNITNAVFKPVFNKKTRNLSYTFQCTTTAGLPFSGTYTVPPPIPVITTSVTGVTSASGPAMGGTSVTITGTGFTGATVVKFGGVNATSYTVTDSSHIAAVTPAGVAAGAVTVLVIVTFRYRHPSQRVCIYMGSEPAFHLGVLGVRVRIRASFQGAGSNVAGWNDISGTGDPNKNTAQATSSAQAYA